MEAAAAAVVVVGCADDHSHPHPPPTAAATTTTIYYVGINIVAASWWWMRMPLLLLLLSERQRGRYDHTCILHQCICSSTEGSGAASITLDHTALVRSLFNDGTAVNLSLTILHYIICICDSTAGRGAAFITVDIEMMVPIDSFVSSRAFQWWSYCIFDKF